MKKIRRGNPAPIIRFIGIIIPADRWFNLVEFELKKSDIIKTRRSKRSFFKGALRLNVSLAAFPKLSIKSVIIEKSLSIITQIMMASIRSTDSKIDISFTAEKNGKGISETRGAEKRPTIMNIDKRQRISAKHPPLNRCFEKLSLFMCLKKKRTVIK